jgi:hypothetical protein
LNAPAQSRSVSSILVVLALGLSAIYLVPFHVPVHDGLSESFLFGFSNRSAIALLLAFILGFALWTRGLGLRLPFPSSGEANSFRRMGRIGVVCSVAGALFLWMCAGPIAPLGEAQYFLDRYAMYGMGGRLYRDFEFDYGPLMFYLPVWIAHLCHISLGNGYYIAWVLQWALGSWILWKVIEVAARGTRHWRTIFLLLWTFFLTGLPDSGTNYTPLRFCATLVLALGVHRLYTRGASIFDIFGLATIGATAMLVFSPEQGIAFTLGTVLFFLICVRPARRDLLVGLGAFVLVMSMVFCLALRLEVLDNLANVGAGALNFPLLFSFQTLVLLLLLIVAGCVVITGFRTHDSDHPLLYLICLSLISLPAAFSRADVGHIIINTLGALIAVLVVLSQYPAIWRWTWPAFAIVILLAAYSHYTYFRNPIRQNVRTAAFNSQVRSPFVEKTYTALFQLTHKNARAQIEGFRASQAAEIAPNAPRLPSHAHLLAPFGVQRRISPPPDGIQIVTGRYPWLFPMTSTTPVQEKIAEVEVNPDWPLLLRSRDLQICEEDAYGLRNGLQHILLAPYMPRPRQTVHAGRPLCDYINAHYVPSSYASPVPHFFVWVRKSNVAGSASTQ